MILENKAQSLMYQRIERFNTTCDYATYSQMKMEEKNMPKTKIYYYDGMERTSWEEGKDGVTSIVVSNGEAIIYFDDERMITVTSPYMEVYSFYEA